MIRSTSMINDFVRASRCLIFSPFIGFVNDVNRKDIARQTIYTYFLIKSVLSASDSELDIVKHRT